MKRPVLIVCLVAASVVAHPRSASAGLWAWLERFSGPGPFHGNPFLLTACIASDRDGQIALVPSPVRVDRNDGEKDFLPCIYFDKGLYTAKEDVSRGFPRIHASLNDIGGSVRFKDWLDIAAGIGWITLDGGKETHSKFTATPIRIVARPLVPFFDSEMKRRYFGALSVFWKTTFVNGPITGEDFGVERSKFTSDGEFLQSYGLIIDVTALFSKNLKIPLRTKRAPTP
jgi:hypothetical protein